MEVVIKDEFWSIFESGLENRYVVLMSKEKKKLIFIKW